MRITPIITAPTSAWPIWPRPPRKLAPPMMTAAMRVELEQVAVERRAGVGAAGEHHRADAGAEPGDDVDRDEHALDRDAHLDAPPSGRRRPRRSSGPRPSPGSSPGGRAPRRARRRTSSAVPKRRGLAEPGDRVGHAAHRRVVDREREREAPADAEGRERDDEGMRQPPEDIDDAVDRADERRRSASIASDDQRRRVDLPGRPAPPITVASARFDADRQVDAAGQDHQLLAHRDDGDDRGLRDDVAEVAGLQEVRRPEADADHQQHQDQQRPDARAASGRGRQGSALASAARPSGRPGAPPRFPRP